MLEKVLEEYELYDKPVQIFNVDETGMPLDHRPPKVVCRKRTKKSSAITSGNKTQITVVCMCQWSMQQGIVSRQW